MRWRASTDSRGLWRRSARNNWTLEKVIDWCEDEYTPFPNLTKVSEAAQDVLDSPDNEDAKGKFSSALLAACVAAQDLSGALEEMDEACIVGG
jgi:hypothetical protein